MQLSPETFIMAHLLMYLRPSVYKILVYLETQKETRASVIGREYRHEFRRYCESSRQDLSIDSRWKVEEEIKGNLMYPTKAFL